MLARPAQRLCAALSTLALVAALARPAHAGGASGDTLYAQLGARAGIERIVGIALALDLADPRVSDDFGNVNLDRLRARLANEICMVAGGPCLHVGRSLAATHKGLHVNQAKFNAVAEDLQEAMEQAGVPYWTQNRLMARLAPMQRAIVTR
jgi:hemoglobin